MKKLLFILAAAVIVTTGIATQAVVYAEDPASAAQVCEGIGLAVGSDGSCNQGDSTAPSVNKIISAAISILSYVAGIAGIIMIIVGAFKYITSAGDSGKVSSAKTTIMYALIGLVIAALAQVMVRFVLTKATAQTPTPTTCVVGQPC